MDPIAALEWHPGPGAEELVRRKAQLQVLTRQLLERERGLAAYRNELAAFETRYRKALGTRYARLDELADRLDETREADPGPLGPDLDPEDPASTPIWPATPPSGSGGPT
jgi:predicted transcriptional regulator